ncbi:inositol monophosphatase family protein [Nibrella saemangeumensis]|uniref:Inositol-1-monophosphatase n=1 Tax=Nibrella saemangeumensis TaxID=1084526 RepID=A0ABP8MXY8_9BACT
MNDLNSLTQQLSLISKQAGEFIRQERLSFSLESIEYKDVNNLVSYVDKEAEKLLVEHLSKLLPEAGFITEEGTTGQLADRNGLNWVIDPLDGTANFIHNVPMYCVSVGLIDKGRTIAGVIYDINRDECYSAYEGGGSWRDGQRIRVSPVKNLNESMLATGFPYTRFDRMHRYLKILETLMQKTHGLRRMGSAALDLAYVACGRFEAFYEFNLNSWDMAAGVLLVKEAGGIVTDFHGGDEFLFRGDVIAGCAMQPELLEEIRSFWED